MERKRERVKGGRKGGKQNEDGTVLQRDRGACGRTEALTRPREEAQLLHLVWTTTTCDLQAE